MFNVQIISTCLRGTWRGGGGRQHRLGPCHVEQISKIAKLKKLSSLFTQIGLGVVIPEDDEHDVVDGEGGNDAGSDLNDARHQYTRPEHSQ
jgi:hypothetical protein